MPGENLKEAIRLLDKTVFEIDTVNNLSSTANYVYAASLLSQAQGILRTEEMDVIRFGDLKRTMDMSYQPFWAIKESIERLDTIKGEFDNYEVLELLESVIEQLEEVSI